MGFLLIVYTALTPCRTGRWRSSYELDLSQAQATLKGSIQLNVHFFEQGNVQLSTSHTPSIPLPETITSTSSSSEIAKAVLKAISKTEEEYQLELNEVYRDMADKTFRNLRRVLPVSCIRLTLAMEHRQYLIEYNCSFFIIR